MSFRKKEIRSALYAENLRSPLEDDLESLRLMSETLRAQSTGEPEAVFRTFLRELIGKRSLSEFSTQTRIPTATVKKWISGEVRLPTKTNMERLSRASGLSEQQLMILIKLSLSTPKDVSAEEARNEFEARTFLELLKDPGTIRRLEQLKKQMSDELMACLFPDQHSVESPMLFRQRTAEGKQESELDE